MLRTATAVVLLSSLPFAALAAPEGWKPLLDPAELSAILAADPTVRVLHVSGDFAQGHIPGAVFSAYAEWRGPQENPGQLRDIAHLTTLVQGLGITADTPVAVVHEGKNPTDMGTAARVYWTLKSLGVEDLALLNGGFAAWQGASLPVSTEAATVAASSFQPVWSDAWRVSTEEVTKLVDAGDARLLDARPKGFFEGETWTSARPGTIKGAENLTYESWFSGTTMVGPDEARALAEATGKTEAPLTVSFCNTGHWAAINWFALSEVAGVQNTRLYAESMVEYGTLGGALDNEPGRVKVMWVNTKKWVEGLF
jgi:thiosulfate/3-mercaptopyruvate sulfurtransferase